MTPRSRCSPELLSAIDRVKGKRPRTVVDHILEHGYVTTTELKELYGYDHPPRAAGDVKDAGVPLLTKVITVDGRRVGHYYFGNPADIVNDRAGGRTTFSKAFRQTVIDASDGACGVCRHSFDARYLQIDHRVPYAVAGDPDGERDPSDYMPICRECQRRKSWSCEHCRNFSVRDIDTCRSCYWAYPDSYDHAAMEPERRIDLVWTGDQVRVYDGLRAIADGEGVSMSELILRRLLGDKG